MYHVPVFYLVFDVFDSYSTNAGIGVLRRGAGIFQMYDDGAPRWSALEIWLPIWYPCGSCSYGDNPGDGPLIERGYNWYYDNLAF